MPSAVAGRAVTVFMCGDVMTGRGVDQILPHPGDPRLREPYGRDARAYVRLVENVAGPVAQPADVTWPWGNALTVLERLAPDVRVINVETSITRSKTFAPGKDIHYRMSPANIGCLTTARPDVCALAMTTRSTSAGQGWPRPSRCCPVPGLRPAGAGYNQTAFRRPP